MCVDLNCFPRDRFGQPCPTKPEKWFTLFRFIDNLLKEICDRYIGAPAASKSTSKRIIFRFVQLETSTDLCQVFESQFLACLPFWSNFDALKMYKTSKKWGEKFFRRIWKEIIFFFPLDVNNSFLKIYQQSFLPSFSYTFICT